MSNVTTALVERKDMTLGETVRALQEHETQLRAEKVRVGALAIDLHERIQQLGRFEEALADDINNTMQLIAQLTANISALQTSP